MMSGFDTSVFSQPKSNLLKKVIFAFLGVILMGIGIAFNACANLGSDPISVFSYGIHSFGGVNLGTAFNVTNYTLLFIVLIFGRRYINIGTLIHTLFLGIFVNLGGDLYLAVKNFLLILNGFNDIAFRVIMAIIACFLLFFGTAMLIAADIGLDVWTGLAMILRDQTHKEYKFFRVAIDIFSLVVGFFLGGSAAIGVTTVLAALFGGPIIQNFVNLIKKSVFSVIKLKNNDI
ncbi:putative uncharacterized protein [Clostridium sp. CAG:557]|jgi:uncharacterized membrane protein YczE|nr:putative uncharacterized protein [Clostridium sp. CAG:557]